MIQRPIDHRHTWRTLCLLAASAWPTFGLASPYINITFGSGPDGYHSQAVALGADIAKTPLHLGLNHFESKAGDSVTRQQGADLTWNINDDLSVQAIANRTEDASFDIAGRELEVSYDVTTPEFTVKLNLGSNDYRPSKTVPAALLARIPVQRQTQISLSKKVTDALAVNLSSTWYRYSTDPFALAQAIASRRRGAPPGPAFTFSAFPEHAWSAGLTWKFTLHTSASLNASTAKSVIDQRSDSVSAGLDHKVGSATVGIKLTQSTSTEVRNARNAVVMPASRGSYADITFSYTF